MKKIKFKRFPGDTIVVPMLIGVVLNSFVPQVLQIGGFFTGIVNGTSALVGVFLLFLGATIDVRSTPKAIKIGAVVIGTKVALSVLLGLGVAFLCNDNFLGLSSLAVISAVSVANNALYSGIVAQYDAVKGAVAITSLSVGPTVTMIALSSAGLASISVWSIVGSILPLIIGIALGNLSAWFKKTLSAGVTPSIIVVGFALGCGMSIQQLFQGGLSGILLGLVTVFVVGGITVLADKLNGARIVPGKHTRVEGVDQCDKVIHVDQNPIGRTPRSNPATYTGVWDKIRALFAKTPEAQVRGCGPGRFSFNVKGGRCEACHGDGTLKIEMNFLPDVYVECEECHGKRYNRETLEVKYNGKTVSDILDMPISEAAKFFKAYPSISRYLDTLVDVGLGYIRLGQPATTLSGGESQRVKLATELQRRSTGKTVYILDEPTTGLHFEDVNKLLLVLQGLVDKGNTVIIIEHNLDVVKSCDWIIDLGPEGGDGGGTIVAEGTPEHLVTCERSWTGRFLAPMLERASSDMHQ